MQLGWSAPPECPRVTTLTERVTDYVGPTLVAQTSVRARARVESLADGRYALSLQLDTGTGTAERKLEASTCDAVAQAAALLIAMAIDPSLAHRNGAAASTTSPSPPARPGKATDAPSDHEAAPGPSRPFGLNGGVLLDVGSLPGVSFGPQALVFYQPNWLRLAFGGQLLLPSEGRVSGLPTATVDISALMLHGRTCVPYAMHGVELVPCAFGELGQLRGESEGIRQPEKGNALWLALGALLEARFDLGARWRALLNAGVLVPHARRRFYVLTDSGALSAHRVAPAAFRFGFGISYDFQ